MKSESRTEVRMNPMRKYVDVSYCASFKSEDKANKGNEFCL